MCRSMVDIQSASAEIRRGIKKDDRNHRAKIQWSALLHRATINSEVLLNHTTTVLLPLYRSTCVSWHPEEDFVLLPHALADSN